MQEELWRDIPGFEGFYKASTLGRIKSLARRGTYERILNPIINHSGYYNVSLSKYGKSKNYLVHQLVAKTFIPNPLNLIQINHKDGDKLNNKIDNLEWCTVQENITHSIETGLKPDDKGCNNIHSKFNPEDIAWIRRNYIEKDPVYGCKALAKKFNVGKATISDIINYKTYKNIGE